MTGRERKNPSLTDILRQEEAEGRATSPDGILPAAPSRANDVQHGGSHYKGAKFQHWDLIARNHINYLEGCASKYASRWRKKNGIEDIKKGIHYCDKIVELIDECHYRPGGCAPDSDLRMFYEQNGITDTDEVLAISNLCQWKELGDILRARSAMIKLLVKASAGVA